MMRWRLGVVAWHSCEPTQEARERGDDTIPLAFSGPHNEIPYNKGPKVPTAVSLPSPSMDGGLFAVGSRRLQREEAPKMSGIRQTWRVCVTMLRVGALLPILLGAFLADPHVAPAPTHTISGARNHVTP